MIYSKKFYYSLIVYIFTTSCNDNILINILNGISFQGSLLLWVFNFILYGFGEYSKNNIIREFIFHQLSYYNVGTVIKKIVPENNSYHWFLFQIITLMSDSLYHITPVIIMSQIFAINIQNIGQSILNISLVCMLWGVCMGFFYNHSIFILSNNCWGPYKNLSFTKTKLKYYVIIIMIVINCMFVAYR